MSTLAESNSQIATEVFFTDDQICVVLADGREVRTPLEFYPSLKNATKKQRENFQLIGLGTGIHWPDIDEDLSIEGVVAGLKAYNYKKVSA
jgi:hypothetical protein